VDNGTIHIGTEAVEQYANKVGITPAQAAKELAQHEFGHVYNQQRDKDINPGNNASMDKKVEYCLTRESEAAATDYMAAFDEVAAGGNQAQHVVGPPSMLDMYTYIKAKYPDANPHSSQFFNALVLDLKGIYRADSQYVAFCKNPKGWFKPSYLNPDAVSPGATYSGSSGGGAITHIPNDVSYVQYPPNDSNAIGENPDGGMLAQVVGINNLHATHTLI
jgi:hypothetical protein